MSPTGSEARARCGVGATVAGWHPAARKHVVHMVDAQGNEFFGTILADIVTCKKCQNLNTIGTLHAAPRKAAS